MSKRLLAFCMVLVAFAIIGALLCVHGIAATITTARTVSTATRTLSEFLQTDWELYRTIDANDANDPNIGWSYVYAEPSMTKRIDNCWQYLVFAASAWGDNLATDPNDPNVIDDPNLVDPNSAPDDPNVGSFDWSLYLGKDKGSMIKVAVGNWKIGQGLMTNNPVTGGYLGTGIWRHGEKPTVTTNSWPTAPLATGYADNVGLLHVRTYGADFYEFRVYDMNDVGKVMVYVTGASQ